MKNLGLIALILTLSLCNAKELQVEEEMPKMPVYIGLGYNLVTGNPLSNFVDTGFGSPIFKITYKQNQKTSDNRFLIPDGITSRMVSSCSFKSSVNEHRGTQSYQKAILDKVTTKEGMQVSVFEASFSKSRSWQILEKTTIEQKMSVTHATAECEAYHLSVDLFKSFALEESFQAAVNSSYHKGNWENFIEQFGTHFVNSVTMGGRAVQEIAYSSKAMSKLKSLDIDVATAAKARFAKFFGDRQTDWHEYEEQVNYTQYFTNDTNEIYIGGHPPRDGNVMTWVQNVITNPMPIRYSNIELTQLFEKISILEIKLNLAKVKKSFVSALQGYCKKIGCKKPIPDLPKPKPAKVEVTRSDAEGNEGGGPFQYFLPNPMVRMLRMLVIWSDKIRWVQLQLTDGVKNTYSPAFGQTGGYSGDWYPPEGEYITQVEYSIGTCVNGFNLISNKGNKSYHFGTSNGYYVMVTFPDDYRIIGLYGRAGADIDKLGFVLGRTVYPDDSDYETVSHGVIKQQKTEILMQ